MASLANVNQAAGRRDRSVRSLGEENRGWWFMNQCLINFLLR
jgi:hypothetical protein